MSIQYLDPEEGPVKSPHSISPRPESLDGAHVAILDNGKTNSRELLKRVFDRLRSLYDDLSSDLLTKPSAFKPAPDSVLTDVEQFDALLTGIGD